MDTTILTTLLTVITGLTLASAFAKTFTVLTILRIGLGLRHVGFGFVIWALSFTLSALLIQPVISPNLYQDWFNNGKKFEFYQAVSPFLEKHSNPEVLNKFTTLTATTNISNKNKVPTQVEDPDPKPVAKYTEKRFYTVLTAFLVTEITEAFELGITLLLPFLLVDLFLAHTLTLLSVTNIPLETIGIPLKLFLFILVDGWSLITEKLIYGYI
jgi:flagellar biosynthesis protein FliP